MWVCRFDSMREGRVKGALEGRGVVFPFDESSLRIHSTVHRRHLVDEASRARVSALRGQTFERDVLFAHVEGLLEAPGDESDESGCASESAVTVVVGLADGGTMRGVVERDPTTSQITLRGPLFSYSYMSAHGTGVVCMNLLERVEGPLESPRSLDFCSIAAAMQSVDGLSVASPKLDAIFPFQLDASNVRTAAGLDALAFARSRRERVPVVDCHLSAGSYMFGSTAQYLHTPYCALMSMLRSLTGENAWRLRGSVAIDAAHALTISRLSGKSIIPLVTGIGTHAVCLVVRVRRDAHGNATKIHLIGRNSYADSNLRRSRDAKDHFRQVAQSLRDVPLARNARVRATWHEPETSSKWETQSAEGSCAVHSLMMALRIAQDEVSGNVKFLSARIGARCPVEFAAVCAVAMRAYPHESPDEAGALKFVFEIYVHELDVAIFGAIRCDGSVVCGVKSRDPDSETGHVWDVGSALRAVEPELHSAARHAQLPIHASFAKQSCGIFWEDIADAAERAGYRRTRSAAYKTYDRT